LKAGLTSEVDLPEFAALFFLYFLPKIAVTAEQYFLRVCPLLLPETVCTFHSPAYPAAIFPSIGGMRLCLDNGRAYAQFTRAIPSALHKFPAIFCHLVLPPFPYYAPAAWAGVLKSSRGYARHREEKVQTIAKKNHVLTEHQCLPQPPVWRIREQE